MTYRSTRLKTRNADLWLRIRWNWDFIKTTPIAIKDKYGLDTSDVYISPLLMKKLKLQTSTVGLSEILLTASVQFLDRDE